MATTLKRELQWIAEACRAAGAVTLRYFGRDVRTSWKADATPVTVADLEAEDFLRQRLETDFPADGIFGEERAEKPGTSGRRWMIDPIDGTKSFLQGVPLFAVLLGLEADGEQLAGGIYLPALDELVVAARGEGCHWNDAPARVSGVTSLADSCVLYTSCRNFDRGGERAVRSREKLVSASRMMRGWGDAYGYVLVATGRAEAMLDPIINPWDIAPMPPILEEAGGTLTDWSGRRTIHGENCVATNGAIADEVLEILRTG